MGGSSVDGPAQRRGVPPLEVRPNKNAPRGRIRDSFRGELAGVRRRRCRWPRYSIGGRPAGGGAGERRATGLPADPRMQGGEDDYLMDVARTVAQELTAGGHSVTRDAMTAALRVRGHRVGTGRAASLARLARL